MNCNLFWCVRRLSFSINLSPDITNIEKELSQFSFFINFNDIVGWSLIKTRVEMFYQLKVIWNGWEFIWQNWSLPSLIDWHFRPNCFNSQKIDLSLKLHNLQALKKRKKKQRKNNMKNRYFPVLSRNAVLIRFQFQLIASFEAIWYLKWKILIFLSTVITTCIISDWSYVLLSY